MSVDTIAHLIVGALLFWFGVCLGYIAGIIAAGSKAREMSERATAKRVAVIRAMVDGRYN